MQGAAVYLTAATEGVPTALLHHLEHDDVVHERVLFVTVDTALESTVPDDLRSTSEQLGAGIARVRLRYGFMESPTIPAA